MLPQTSLTDRGNRRLNVIKLCSFDLTTEDIISLQKLKLDKIETGRSSSVKTCKNLKKLDFQKNEVDTL